MEQLNFIGAIKEDDLMLAVETGFVDKNRISNAKIQPKFIYNERSKHLNANVLNVLHKEIEKCKEFWISVAFFNEAGLAAIKQQLLEAAERGVKGRILTSTYLHFNKPKAFLELLKLKNVEVRVLDEPCHTKGYRFYYENYGNLIIGSSNLTISALKTNEEWNIKLSSLDQGAVLDNVDFQFEKLWKRGEVLTYEWIEKYKPFYESNKMVRVKTKITPMELATLQPNLMQREAMYYLNKLREEGAKKALLISATGTGKTFLSAFDVRSYAPKKMLFLAHREQLLEQAKNSYQKVLGDTVSYGIYSGTKKEWDADFVFSTVQTLSKDENLQKYARDYFDYIIVDEVHRAGAPTYIKILDYFEPKFMLGMTATPERGDNVDIYKLFDYNIAYEIRLQKALEMDLLCPFQYFGVEDISVDGKLLEDDASFNELTSTERVRQILEKANYYGYSGDRVKGLVFCNSVKVAEELAKAFNNAGYPSLALSGENNQQERINAIKRLQSDKKENYLNYIFTVDIFNEGVDIPEVNQVIMLRPTESAIIFVQQLGRGLRKANNKSYVTILDFIGNCKKSYLIPIALSGDRSYNKDNIRRFISEDSKFLPGLSTINFAKITKERIFNNIDSTNLSTLKLLKEAYFELKKKIGRIPNIVDFERYGSMDIQNYFNYAGSYYNFLVKADDEFKTRFTPTQEVIMKFVCKFLSQGKRVEDLLVVKELINNRSVVLDIKKELAVNIRKVLSNKFQPNKNDAKQYMLAKIVAETSINFNEFIRTESFTKAIKSNDFVIMLLDVIEYGIRQYNEKYSDKYKNTDFVLNEKYTYDEVCRLLLWNKNVTALNIGGYMYNKETNTMPVFINYHKEDDIKDSINYEDRFLNESTLIALSKSKRSMDSLDIKRLQNYEKNNMKIYLFVRKNKDDKNSKEFYFLGEIHPQGKYEEVNITEKETAVEIYYKLDTPVRADLYDYITVS